MYKCYNTASETMGLINGEYQRFSSESEYKEMYEESKEN